MSTEVTSITGVGIRSSNGVMGNVRTIAAEVKRLPLIPMVMLLVVLIIPAIFAPAIAPHDPLKAPLGLTGRLQPPSVAGGRDFHPYPGRR